MSSLNKLIEKFKIKMSSEPVDKRPDGDGWADGSSHYKVLITALVPGENESSSMSLYYSMGPGLKGSEPTLNDILECLSMDSSSTNGQNFEDWAGDFGYDSDSRKAEKIFNQCIKQSHDLKRLLGDEGFEELIQIEF